MDYDEFASSRLEEVYVKLGSNLQGLTKQEADLRLKEFGPNSIPSAKKRSIVSRVIEQLKNGFCILLLTAAALSIFTGITYSDPGSVQTGYALIVVVAISIAFSIYQEYRAEQAIQAIKNLIPTKTKVLRSGSVEEKEVTEIVKGDIIILDEGDKVPADLRLVSAFEVSVNNSLLTGESEPVRRSVNITQNMNADSVTDYQNLLFAGSTMVSGIARGIVISTGKDTQFGRIVSISNEFEESPSPLQQEINFAARLTLILASAVGISFFFIAKLLFNLSIVANILFAIGVILSFVPWGFQLTISLSLAIAASKMAKKNVVIKRLSAIETMGYTTVLCVDKTGTITSGEMMVEKLWVDGKVFDVSGDGYNPKGSITINGRGIEADNYSNILRLLEVSVFCNNAKLVAPTNRVNGWSVLGDPTDGAFLVFARKGDLNATQALSKRPRVCIIPFNSQRRMMTVIHREMDGQLRAYSKGSSYEVLERCLDTYHENRIIPISDKLREEIKSRIVSFASEGYRVLALASKKLPTDMLINPERIEAEYIENKMTFLGLAALHDPPRPNTENAVEQAHQAGIRVIMITGDNELTAKAIAKRTSILDEKCKIVSGPELNKMSETKLSDTIKGTVAFARAAPENKLRIVKAFLKRGDTVAVTGDGVNDAPALTQSDIGISMGGGTDVARESSDIVLLDNDFASIVEAIKLGRGTFDNLRKFAYYMYTHCFAELITFIAFIMLRVPLPLTLMGVLALEAILEIPMGLSLITEPPEDEVLNSPPRKRNERLLKYGIFGKAVFVGTVEGVLPMLFAFYIWSMGGWHLGQSTVNDPVLYATGTTAVLVGIMLGQLGNLFSARTGSYSILSSNPVRNKWILIGSAAMLLMLASMVYLPPLQFVFGTAPLALSDWTILFATTLTIILLCEILKLLSKIKLRNK